MRPWLTPLAAWIALLTFFSPQAALADENDILSREQTRYEEARAREIKVLDSLDRLERQLGELELGLEDTGLKLRAVSRQLKAKERESARLDKQIKATRARLKARLAAIYRLRGRGLAELMLSANSVSEVARRYKYLGAILDHDTGVIEEYNELLAQAQAQARAIARTRAELAGLEARMREQEKGVRATRAAATELLIKVHREKEYYLAMVKAQREARERLVKEVFVSSGRVEREPTEDPKGGPAGGDRPKFADFEAEKGRLPMPVDGRIVDHFGQNPRRFGTYTTHQGVTIKADAGEAVRAVLPGRIIYVDWLRGYGEVVIIHHGQRYYTLTAGLTRVRVQTNDWVQARDVLGYVPSSGKNEEKSIYFEVRRASRALDPALWLVP